LIQLGQSRKFESITGAIFSGKVLRETRCGNHPAVTVEVAGNAHYTGTARFTLEPGDEIGKGFLLK
jgi:trans-L-3-hydroxyproline dehydratase